MSGILYKYRHVHLHQDWSAMLRRLQNQDRTTDWIADQTKDQTTDRTMDRITNIVFYSFFYFVFIILTYLFSFSLNFFFLCDLVCDPVRGPICGPVWGVVCGLVHGCGPVRVLSTPAMLDWNLDLVYYSCVYPIPSNSWNKSRPVLRKHWTFFYVRRMKPKVSSQNAAVGNCCCEEHLALWPPFTTTKKKNELHCWSPSCLNTENNSLRHLKVFFSSAINVI